MTGGADPRRRRGELSAPGTGRRQVSFENDPDGVDAVTGEGSTCERLVIGGWAIEVLRGGTKASQLTYLELSK